LYDELIKVVI